MKETENLSMDVKAIFNIILTSEKLELKWKCSCDIWLALNRDATNRDVEYLGMTTWYLLMRNKLKGKMV